MEVAGGSKVAVISVASKRKTAVCLTAGNGVFGRVLEIKLCSQAAVGNRCRALRCCVSSAARLVAIIPSSDVCVLKVYMEAWIYSVMLVDDASR